MKRLIEMSVVWKQVFAWSLAAILLAAAGCGSGNETDAKTDAGNSPAEQNGAPSAAPDSSAAPAASLAPAVRIDTTLGSITVELDPERAGVTVNNFLKYVDRGQYDNTIFHQVFKDKVVLGGSFTPELEEKPTDGPIYNEARNGLKNVRATIAMARQSDVIDSATAQFFINVQDNPSLDHKETAGGETQPQDYGYCVFGKVTEGMEVVDKISNLPVHDRSGFEQTPVETVRITSITQLR
jgi:cyclophilin family peptidyl-prolyl cis-trans isomerase